MKAQNSVVPLEDAIQQVKTAVCRIALLHLGFSKTIVKEMGREKGEKLIIKSIVEYGKLLGRHTLKGGQDLPHYGFHDKYRYDAEEFIDMREGPFLKDEAFDFAHFKVFGCVLAEIFSKLGEEELGKLYCYVDPAKSMAEDPMHKLIHKSCEPCGDSHCSFDRVPTTEKERESFKSNAEDWKDVDPIIGQASAIRK